MNASQRTALPVFLILAMNYVHSDGICNSQERGSLGVIGVFDFGDTSSLEGFENAISRHNSLNQKQCVPKLTSRTLLVKSDTSVSELIGLAEGELQGGPCFMVYAAEDNKGRIVLDLALSHGINIVTAIQEFSMDYPYEEKNYNYDRARVISVNRTTSAPTQLSALLSLFYKLNWRKFVVVTDNVYESSRFVNLLEESLVPWNLEMIDWLLFTPDSPTEEMFYRFSNLGEDSNTILLITNSLAMANDIFGAKEGVSTSSWIFVSDLLKSTFTSTSFPDMIYTLTPRSLQEITISGFVDDAVRSISLALTKRRDTEVGTCPKLGQMRRLLTEVNFHGSSGPVKFDDNGNRVPLGYDVCTMKYVGERDIGGIESQIIELGYWSNDELYIRDLNDLPRVKILLNEYPPNVMSQPRRDGEPCQSNSKPCVKRIDTSEGKKSFERCCYGFVIDVLQSVINEYPFIPELLFSLDGQYGIYDDANDSWNGVVSELLSGRGDASFDLYISSRRATVLDFTEPYMPSGIRLLAKEKEREDNQIYWLSYLRPFTPPVWLTLLGSLGVMIFFLWGIEKISPVYASKKLFHRNSSFKLDNAVCFALALAFGRPADESKPTTNGARFSSVAFGMAMLVFVSTYSANLAAFLIVDDKTTPVEDIYDLKIETPPDGFKYGTIDGSYMADYFKNSENAYFRHVWYHMQHNNVKSLSEGVEAVKTGKLDVFVADHVGLEFESMNDPSCQLKVVGEPFAMSGASIAVKKDNPLFIPLSEALQRIKAKGLTDYIQQFWVSKYSCKRETPPTQLEVADLSGLFLQLTIAMIACILGTLCHRTFIFLYDREKCKSNDEDIDEEDARCRFAHTETLV